MPTYEYRCKQCACRFEKLQSIKEEPLKTCPECGGEPERLIGCGAGFIFKGSGFYITDYRSESYKKAAKAEKNSDTPIKTEKSAVPSVKSEKSGAGKVGAD